MVKNILVYVQKDWVFGCGFINNDPFIKKLKLFDGLYTHMNFEQHRDRSLYNMLALQNWLRSQHIPWIFSFYKNYVEDLKKSHFWKYLDLKHIFLDDNLFDITERLSLFDTDGLHPNTQAHEIWADALWKYLVKKGPVLS